MTILYLCHRIPYPPDKGDKIRSFHQVRELSRRHRVHLFCLVDEPRDRAHVGELRRYCASVDAVYIPRPVVLAKALGALATRRPLSVAAFGSAELSRRIAGCVGTIRPDLVFVFSGAMAQYLDAAPGLPVVIDLVDVDSAKWRRYAEEKSLISRWIYRAEAQRLGRFEAVLAARYAPILFVSRAEAELFHALVPGSSTAVIPTGVDLDYFRPDPAPRESPSRLVFVGMMDYFPNVDAVRHFCEQVLPRVQASLPEARLTIVGRNPSSTVRQLARLPGVEVTGGVDDVRPYLRDAAVSIAPFRIARGIQSKVLEAMAMGLPVVGTTVALQGLDATVEDGVRIEDDPGRMAKALLDLLTRTEERRRAGARARLFVEQHHRWEEHGRRLEHLLGEAVARHGTPS